MQEARGLADLPEELGGNNVIQQDTSSGIAASKKSGNQAKSQEASELNRRQSNIGLGAQSAAKQGAKVGEQMVADSANVAAISLLETGQEHVGFGAAANASREVMPYKSINLKKVRAGRQNKGVGREKWRRRQSEVVKACKARLLCSFKYHSLLARIWHVV